MTFLAYRMDTVTFIAHVIHVVKLIALDSVESNYTFSNKLVQERNLLFKPNYH